MLSSAFRFLDTEDSEIELGSGVLVVGMAVDESLDVVSSCLASSSEVALGRVWFDVGMLSPGLGSSSEYSPEGVRSSLVGGNTYLTTGQCLE